MRRVVFAALTALVPSLSVVGLAAPAGSASLPVYVHHAVLMSAVLTGTLPGHSGSFHQVRLEAGSTDVNRPVAEAAGPVYAEIADFTCPAGFTATDFVSQPVSCTEWASPRRPGWPCPTSVTWSGSRSPCRQTC